MKHSKHLTVFLGVLLMLLVVGVLAYLYMTYIYEGEYVEADPSEISESDTQTADFFERTRVRLETVSPGADLTDQERQAAADRLQVGEQE